MRAVDIIIKKREGQVLNRKEIDFFIQGFAKGKIPDYQAAAWAMAVVLKGMTFQEIGDLTLAMADTGDHIDLKGVVPIAVDKHSTGGVGDKTTLVVEPVIAACGLPVAKISGRGLGFTGGTLDKMESIPGFRVELSTGEFLDQLRRIGLVLSGQTADLAPADGKLYALRDVTGTIQSIPLIASSIMSKKIAAGAHRILLDVKVGRGAFMTDLESARRLAETMVWIGKQTGRETVALLSDMNQPLGCAVGNALELQEAVETLQGGGPKDLRNHCIRLASYMLVLGELVKDEQDGAQMAEKVIANGKALDRFRELVRAQGGDVSYIADTKRLPTAIIKEDMIAPRAGYVRTMDALAIGEAAVLLGAGREKKGDPIDHGVGIVVHRKVGDRVKRNERLITLYANYEPALAEALRRLANAVELSDSPVEPLQQFHGVIRFSDLNHPDDIFIR